MRYFTICALASFPFAGAFATFSATTSFHFFASIILLILAFSFFFESGPTRISKSIILLLFPLLIAAVHLLLGGSGYNGDHIVLRYLCLTGFVLYFSQENHGFSLSDLRLSFRISISILVILAVASHFQEFRFGLARIGGTPRIDLTFGNPNYLAAYLLTALPLFIASIYDGFRLRKAGLQWVDAIYILSIFYLILMTGSRGVIFLSVLMLGITFITFIVCAKKTLIVLNRGLVLFTIAAVVSISTAWAITQGDQVIDKTISLLSGGGQSEAGRLVAYEIAWSAVNKDATALLFGSGPGSFFSWAMWFPDMELPQGFEANKYKHVHSEYLEILVEVGFIGIAFLSAFVLLSSRDLLDRIKRKHEERRHEIIALGASLVLVGIFAALSVATRQMVVLLPLITVAALLLRFTDKPIQLSQKVSYGIRTIIFVACILSSQGAWKSFQSEKLLADARSAAAQGKSKTSFQLTMDAVEADPRHIESLYLKLSSLAFLGPNAPEGELEATFAQIQSVFPNFRNAPAIYARYLLATGEDKLASEILSEYTEIRQLSLSSLIDLTSAHARLGNIEAANETLYQFFLRSAQLEENQSDGLVTMTAEASGQEISMRGADQSTRINVPLFVSTLPEAVFANPVHLKQAIYFEATRLYRLVTEPSLIPQFIYHLPHDEKQFMTKRLKR